MTQFATTYTRFDQIGVREQLSNIISNISPTDTPFLSGAGKGKASNTQFDWQTDALATASSTNQQIEGDDITSIAAATPTVRLLNYCEIARKLIAVSETARVVDTAGRQDELSYQIAKQGKELKRDQETSLLANKGAAAGSSASARKTAALPVFIKTNINKASNGTAPVYTTTATDVWTDGTNRTFTEVILKDVVQQCFTSGAKPETVMVGAFNKQVASSFAGVVELNSPQTKTGQATIIGAANVYVSDFGNLTIIPNRFQQTNQAIVIDWDMVQVNYLRPYQVEELAKTGDAQKRMLIAEYGLQVQNEKGLGIATALSPS